MRDGDCEKIRAGNSAAAWGVSATHVCDNFKYSKPYSPI
jgi:hypothetical protein